MSTTPSWPDSTRPTQALQEECPECPEECPEDSPEDSQEEPQVEDKDHKLMKSIELNIDYLHILINLLKIINKNKLKI